MRGKPVAGLLAAACGIVAGEGLAGLTLRPLAEALGVSVTVLTRQYGDRAGIMAAICEAASAHDAVRLGDWREMLAALPLLPPATAAALAESMLEEAVTHGRALSMLYLEMLHACTWDAALRPAFAGWAAQRRGFWDGFGAQAGLATPLTACGWWHGYVIAELAYGVALDGDLPYRMVRRLCLQRLFAGGAAPAPDAADGALFALLCERMRHAGDAGEAGAGAGVGVGTAAGRVPAWSAQAARACGMRLAAQGVNGLTHRAVAADIGIPHTTLSYRFPTQHDLVIAGLESIAAHILSAVEGGSLEQLQRLRTEGDGRKLDLARGNFAVALAAARMPALAPYTAHMRSRRGHNLVKVFGKYLPDARGIDALCASVVSMGLTGLTNTEPPGEASERSVASAFASVGAWLRQGRAGA
jgi:AcrR family transcriptional regulator